MVFFSLLVSEHKLKFSFQTEWKPQDSLISWSQFELAKTMSSNHCWKQNHRNEFNFRTNILEPHVSGSICRAELAYLHGRKIEVKNDSFIAEKHVFLRAECSYWKTKPKRKTKCKYFISDTTNTCFTYLHNFLGSEKVLFKVTILKMKTECFYLGNQSQFFPWILIRLSSKWQHIQPSLRWNFCGNWNIGTHFTLFCWSVIPFFHSQNSKGKNFSRTW